MADDEVDLLTQIYSFLHKEDSIVYVPNLLVNFPSCNYITDIGLLIL